MTKSEFAEWFEAQHGKRETGLLQGESDLMLDDQINRGKVASAQLEARKLWDEKRQAALYAWTARYVSP
jgi:hypothetical protein